jgi:glycine hydroxymethyltransferase
MSTEQIAIDRLKKLFGADAANVQPNSGSQANQAVLMAFAKPGDTIMGMSLAEGGHLTHGMALNMSGKWFNVVSYGLNEKEEIDYEKMEALAREHKPKNHRRRCLCLLAAHRLGAFRQGRQGSRRHFLGRHGPLRRPDRRRFLPEPGAFRRRRYLDHAQDPAWSARWRHPDEGRARKGPQFRHLPRPARRPAEHVIAAKAVAFKEAATPEFRNYQEQVINNARVMARVLGEERGLRIVSGRTESHVFLLDLRAKNITGKEAEAALGRAHITVNKNGIPNDPQKPFVTSGIRIGSPAMTTRGFTEIEAEQIRSSAGRRA